MEEEREISYEEVMLWLPSHVLDNPTTHHHTKTNLHRLSNNPPHQYRHRTRLPPPPPDRFPTHLKSGHKQNNNNTNRAKQVNNSGSIGGPGMQAIFLNSGQKSGGTGVFLPTRPSANFQPSKKPACSPVLLPSRVVQALNLNVHALGLQVSPRQELKHKNASDRDSNNTTRKKNNRDASTKCCVVSHNQRPSPAEIFLPKEWTY